MFEFRFPHQKIEDFRFPPCKNCPFPSNWDPPPIKGMSLLLSVQRARHLVRSPPYLLAPHSLNATYHDARADNFRQMLSQRNFGHRSCTNKQLICVAMAARTSLRMIFRPPLKWPACISGINNELHANISTTQTRIETTPSLSPFRF